GVERLRNDVGVDLLGRERRRHFRWWQNLKVHFLLADLLVLALDHWRKTGIPQRHLQHDVVHRGPEGYGNLLAAEISKALGTGVRTDHHTGAVRVRPGNDLHWKLVVVAHPDGDGLEQ